MSHPYEQSDLERELRRRHMHVEAGSVRGLERRLAQAEAFRNLAEAFSKRDQERVAELQEALRKLLDFAEGADMQLDQEFGVGDYEEAEEIIAARSVLASPGQADPE